MGVLSTIILNTIETLRTRAVSILTSMTMTSATTEEACTVVWTIVSDKCHRVRACLRTLLWHRRRVLVLCNHLFRGNGNVNCRFVLRLPTRPGSHRHHGTWKLARNRTLYHHHRNRRHRHRRHHLANRGPYRVLKSDSKFLAVTATCLQTKSGVCMDTVLPTIIWPLSTTSWHGGLWSIIFCTVPIYARYCARLKRNVAQTITFATPLRRCRVPGLCRHIL